MLLGHPIDLKAKAGGEKSMSEKRGSLEDAEGAVPQDPRDRRKLHCLNPNPQRCDRTLAATASLAQRYQGPLVQVARVATSDWQGDG